ncbi:ABC transporter [Terrabacter tumescens]|uniref:ABC transporter n=1 Tax=Terrabacter tumescens TaxID=60443 RepID=A0ABQ2HM50_9MICO|nr:DUF302 domain-containing protein [Terrabacter tumescens]GGM85954.1 ABC transporter [Terrabacter tumescens]
MSHSLSTTLELGFDRALEATRAQLTEVGFGILTEIDLAGTLKAKLGADVAPQVILGACRPPLALAAIEAEPSIGVFLPCNVVVRSVDETHTVVEAIDPDAMVRLTDNETLATVAADARERLTKALAALDSAQ